jgi:hypothetical protein
MVVVVALVAAPGEGQTAPEASPPPPVSQFRPPPGPPHPMDLTRRLQLYGGPFVAFGGALRSDWQPFDPEPLDRVRIRWPLDPTVGAFLGLDWVPSRYFAVGPRITFGAWRPQVNTGAVHEPGSQRSFDVDVGVSLRPRFPLHIGRVYVEASLAVVPGLTFGSVRDLGERHFAPGFHLGILPGLRVLFTPQLGLMVELGYIHHALWHYDEWLDGRERSARNQGVVNLGVVTTLR